MKPWFIFFFTICTIQAEATEPIYCRGQRALQAETGDLTQESEFQFELDRTNKENIKINSLNGYFNVKTPFIDGAEITADNGYRAQFTNTSLTSDPLYRPTKYKSWVQFRNLVATATDSLERGMWGNLILDLRGENTFEGRYIFQAGSHMGGTLNLFCRVVE